MKNVNIQISDELYDQFKTLPDNSDAAFDLSIKLLRAIIKALLPNGGIQ